MGINKTNVPRRIHKKKKETRNLQASANHCSKVGCKAANCWEHEANKDKRPKSWKKKEEKEVGASNIEVL